MGNENEVRVSSWVELVEQLYVEAWQPDIQRHRSSFAFRGLPDSVCKLETSLQRLGGDYSEMERHLLRNFRKYAGRAVVESDSVWHWVSLAKHHGLPTRLLDWSFSPFVALHFATENIATYHLDGAIWMVDYGKVHEHLPERLLADLRKEGADVFTVDMLSRDAKTMSEFGSLAEEPFPVFFEPPSIDDRIVNQYALFSVMSSVGGRLDEWLAQHPDLQRRVVFPAEMKWEVRDKLDQANVTERVLFPGLDGLSAWLRRQYSPRT